MHRAAALWPDDEAVVDRDTRLTFAELDAAVREAAKAFVATGLQPGDRASVWAPNMHQWIVAALGLYSAGGVLVPLNTRFKGTEAAHVLRTSGTRFLFTVTDFLDTNYVELLDDAGARDLVEEIVILEGSVPDGHRELGRLPGARCDRRRRPRVRGARSGAHRRHDVRHHLHVGHHRRAEGRDAAPRCQRARCTTSWAEVVGLRHGDRYLLIYPLFHTAGLKSGLLASLLNGVTLLPHLVFDPQTVMETVRSRTRHHAPRTAGDLPDDPQHRRQRVRPVVAAPRGHRRRRRARSSSW